MGFQYTIKKCLITVDRKKYTKNEINISDNLMFITYSKPSKYNGRVMVSMKNPSENVSKINYNGDKNILSFQWKGLWEDEDTGKESKKTLDFKIEFDRSIDGHRVYFPLIGKKLEGKYKLKSIKKPRVTKRRRVKTIKDIKHNKQAEKDMIKDNPWMLDDWAIQTTKKLKVKTRSVKKSKKKGRKGPEESATKFPVGTEKKGNDGNMWVINVSKNGIQRWVKKGNILSARGKK